MKLLVLVGIIYSITSFSSLASANSWFALDPDNLSLDCATWRIDIVYLKVNYNRRTIYEAKYDTPVSCLEDLKKMENLINLADGARAKILFNTTPTQIPLKDFTIESNVNKCPN